MMTSCGFYASKKDINLPQTITSPFNFCDTINYYWHKISSLKKKSHEGQTKNQPTAHVFYHHQLTFNFFYYTDNYMHVQFN